MVGQMPDFMQNGIYWSNEEGDGASDAAHRAHANYADHLARVTRIESVSADELRNRIATAASTALEGPTSRPDRTRFADLSNVIGLAYLRIYRFREYLDDLLPPRNPFWRASRELGVFKNVMQFPPRPAAGIQAN
jgi:hypothetical protein